MGSPRIAHVLGADPLFPVVLRKLRRGPPLGALLSFSTWTELLLAGEILLAGRCVRFRPRYLNLLLNQNLSKRDLTHLYVVLRS